MKTNDIIKDRKLVIVILGVKPDANGHATKQMINRALSGVRLLHKYPGALCIVSGGKTSIDHASEAFLLQTILVNNRVDKNLIVLEDNSKNTLENVLFSIKTVNETIGNDNFSVIVCTEKYHAYRAELLFKMNGINILNEKKPKLERSLTMYRKSYLILRECLALIKDINLMLYIKYLKNSEALAKLTDKTINQ